MENLDNNQEVANSGEPPIYSYQATDSQIPAEKKWKRVLRIIGYVTFAFAVIFTLATIYFAAVGTYSGDELGVAFFKVFMIGVIGFFSIYPAFLFGLLSAIFLSFSIKRYKKALVLFIISLIIMLAALIYTIALFLF